MHFVANKKVQLHKILLRLDPVVVLSNTATAADISSPSYRPIYL